VYESHPTHNDPPPESSWQELASREGDGLVVHLDWSRSLGTVRVVVDDRRHGQQFELDVAPEDALAAFRHPFAYAAAHGSSRVALQDALGLSQELEGATHVR
jgi:hypothetical protein